MLYKYFTILGGIVKAENTTDAGRYDFKFNKNGFGTVKSELKDKYGLTLQFKIIQVEQALVYFRKQHGPDR